MAIDIKRNSDSLWLLPLKVTPKASQEGCMALLEEMTELPVKVSAPPDKGQANAAVVSVVAKALGLAKSSVVLLKGETSRHKIVGVVVQSPEDLLNRLCQAWKVSPQAFKVNF